MTLRYGERGVGRHVDRYARTVLRNVDRSLVDFQVRITSRLFQRDGSPLGALGRGGDLLGTLRDGSVLGCVQRQDEREFLRGTGVALDVCTRRSGGSVSLIGDSRNVGGDDITPRP